MLNITKFQLNKKNFRNNEFFFKLDFILKQAENLNKVIYL